MSGAAPLSAELTQQLIELLPHVSIHQGYGSNIYNRNIVL